MSAIAIINSAVLIIGIINIWHRVQTLLLLAVSQKVLLAFASAVADRIQKASDYLL
jgi:hypothetical protein